MALPDTALVADMEAIVANLVRKTLVHPQRCSLGHATGAQGGGRKIFFIHQ